MKKLLFLFILIISTQLSAQKNCEYSVDVKDSIGTLKSTKQYLVYERIFGSTSSSIYLQLSKSDETPYLTVLFINKSPDFIKANCFDAKSKLYFQLENGKIINEEILKFKTSLEFIVSQTFQYHTSSLT